MKFIYLTIFLSIFLLSCAPKEAEPIKINIDQCHQCKMNIADGKFGAELITKKGRVYKFDDIFCLINFCEQNTNVAIEKYFVHDYKKENTLIDAEKAFFCKGGTINSPMHGNIIATENQLNIEQLKAQFQAKSITWKEIINSK